MVQSEKERLSKGFAYRFRPTYAGANMGHPYGVVAEPKKRALKLQETS
jgi:hypothetical protein